MCFEAMFFDLDDTLYPPTAGIWDAIGVRMDLYMIQVMGFKPGEVKPVREKLFHDYGTTLRGLQNVYHVDAVDFLTFVHDVPIDRYLNRSDVLVNMFLNYPQRKIIFTNADQNHARRVLSTLGVMGFFDQIIDILQIQPFCKPLPEAFNKAIKLSGISNPSACVMIDDSARNLKVARELGFYTIQVGTDQRREYADASILTINDLPLVIPIASSMENV